MQFTFKKNNSGALTSASSIYRQLQIDIFKVLRCRIMCAPVESPFAG